MNAIQLPMKKIVILDTWTNNTNLGNKIIVESVYKELRNIFPHDFFYRVPALEYIRAGRVKIEEADYVFLAGTNLLSSDMENTSQWCVDPQEEFWSNKVILMGLGWWQYQTREANIYTRSVLNKILSRKCLHSLRDYYTKDKFEQLGFKGVNTGCPTIWGLEAEHCAEIPDTKSEKVLLTFTEYNMNPEYDRLLFEILEKKYSTVYFWPQMYYDYYYARKICGENLVVIDPSLEALDDLLRSEDVDYVGTRLHAGIRALQHKRRTVIIAVDNRAIEMGNDFKLPVLKRGEIGGCLEKKIDENWKTLIKLDRKAIREWKEGIIEASAGQKAEKYADKMELYIDQVVSLSRKKSIESALEKGVREINANNSAGALKILESAIASFPNQPGLNYGKAIALARLGKITEAVETLKILLAAMPSHRKAQQLIVELNAVDSSKLLEQAKQSLNSNNPQQAFNLLNQAKKLQKPIENLDYLRSICFLKQSQPSAALQALQEELRYFPQNTQAENLKNKLLAQYPQLITSKINDPEFQQLLQAIRPYTMLSEARLYSLFSLVKQICQKNLPGNIVECGVAGGGSTALMASVIKRYSKQPRWLYAFDSFAGMPAPTEKDRHKGIPADATGWGTGTCAAPETSVREICSKLGVSPIVKPVKGYFHETLPKMKNMVGMISLLHLDGDWYESTKIILENLYDRVVNDGYIQVDDYGHWEGCRQAVDEFAHQQQLHFDIKPIDGTGIFFTKPDKFPLNSAIAVDLVREFWQVDPVVYGIQSQMSVNERFQLYYVLRQLLPKHSSSLRFIEIGSYAGSSLLLECQTFKRIAPQFHGFAIDPGGHPQLAQVLKHLHHQVTHLRMLSHQAAPQLKSLFAEDGKLPIFIFIDGDHSYEGVRQDILDYFPLLAPGGIMVFHDYLPPLNDENREAILFHHGGNEPGIRQACQELMETTYGCEILDIPLLYPTDPTQTQAHLPIIPGVFSTIRAYRKL